ncbi:hypothetical protein V2J09_019597 [Rumex salicifolius]
MALGGGFQYCSLSATRTQLKAPKTACSTCPTQQDLILVSVTEIFRGKAEIHVPLSSTTLFSLF